MKRENSTRSEVASGKPLSGSHSSSQRRALQLRRGGVHQQSQAQHPVAGLDAGLDPAQIGQGIGVGEDLCGQGLAIGARIELKWQQGVGVERAGAARRRGLRLAGRVEKAQLDLPGVGLPAMQADLQLRIGGIRAAALGAGVGRHATGVAMACQKAWATSGLAMSEWAPLAPPPWLMYALPSRL